LAIRRNLGAPSIVHAIVIALHNGTLTSAEVVQWLRFVPRWLEDLTSSREQLPSRTEPAKSSSVS
jgi:hypothetical protein